jgi:hypothetical protein
VNASYLPSVHLQVEEIIRPDVNGDQLLISFNRRPTDQELRLIHEAVGLIGYAFRQDNPAHEVQ